MQWRPRFGLKSLMLLVLLAAIVCAAVRCVVRYWEYIPGTLSFSPGNQAYGTGWRTRYFYGPGGAMAKEYYRAGDLVERIWYKPDGSVAVTNTYHRDGINFSFVLRQDGSLEEVYQAKYFEDSEGSHGYQADGPSIHFRPDGSVERVEEYRDGLLITSPPTSQQIQK